MKFVENYRKKMLKIEKICWEIRKVFGKLKKQEKKGKNSWKIRENKRKIRENKRKIIKLEGEKKKRFRIVKIKNLLISANLFLASGEGFLSGWYFCASL